MMSAVQPLHDFHTSWMNMTYHEKNKVFDISWRTDTEHLEGALTAFAGKDVSLQTDQTDKHKDLLNAYIKANSFLKLNATAKELDVAIVEVNFAETIVHFKPIPWRHKLKSIKMQNSLLLKQFPNQKNMVQINYKGAVYSMLLSTSKLIDEINLK
jgi:hypothetical protein